MQKQSTNASILSALLLPFLFVLLVGLFGSCEPADYILGHLSGEGGGAGQSGACVASGDSCSTNNECCSLSCKEQNCSSGEKCSAEGLECASPLDCCSLACLDGRCAQSCVDDESACSLDEQCCSGTCENETCRPLNDACRTSGNSCLESDECCSGMCHDGICSPASSHCSQEGDSCQIGGDCCSGTCLIEEGRSLGICDQVPQGPSNCSQGIAGTLCDDCNDCCSRVCAQYGDGGTKICLQADGCRQTGELCESDAECCGGDPDSGLPGAGNVSCEIQEGATWGICRNAMSCSPQGNVCHIQDYICTVSAAPNRCCASEGNDGLCILDEDGVPRCDGLAEACLEEGAACAMDNDCCDGSCLWTDDAGYLCGSRSALDR